MRERQGTRAGDVGPQSPDRAPAHRARPRDHAGEPTEALAKTLRDAGETLRAEEVIRLQQEHGNASVSRLIQRALIARDGPDAGAPAPTPAPAASGDPIPTALEELRASDQIIDRNTAAEIDSGRIRAYYIEDCAVHPDSDALLTGWGMDTSVYIVRIHPVTRENLVLQKNYQGTADGNYIFVSRTVSVERTRQILVHETNHAMRLHEGGHADPAESFERYKDEFQAYWVAEFRDVRDLDDRASQIRTHIIGSYAALHARYDTDAEFKRLVDNHNRPDANVLNSPRWQAVERAVAGLGTDEDAIYEAIRGMPTDERAALRADSNFMAMLRGDLSGDELQKAIFLLEGYSEHVVEAIDAMSGLGTDEDALFAAIRRMGPLERNQLRENAWFMARLRDDLSGDDLDKALKLLGGPLGDFPLPSETGTAVV